MNESLRITHHLKAQPTGYQTAKGDTCVVIDDGPQHRIVPEGGYWCFFWPVKGGERYYRAQSRTGAMIAMMIFTVDAGRSDRTTTKRTT